MSRLIIEIKNGSLLGVYTDRRDIEVILVDYDEIDGGSSATIIPDAIDDIPPDTEKLADDAVRRHSKSMEKYDE